MRRLASGLKRLGPIAVVALAPTRVFQISRPGGTRSAAANAACPMSPTSPIPTPACWYIITGDGGCLAEPAWAPRSGRLWLRCPVIHHREASMAPIPSFTVWQALLTNRRLTRNITLTLLQEVTEVART